MNPVRVDFAVDLVYGALIAVAIGLLVVGGTRVGIAFAVGVLLSYLIHVVWKMARYDPDWMTREIAESVEATLSEDIEETVSEEVEETLAAEVEETINAEVGDVKDRIEAVDRRIDRRPRTEEIEQQLEGVTDTLDEKLPDGET